MTATVCLTTGKHRHPTWQAAVGPTLRAARRSGKPMRICCPDRSPAVALCSAHKDQLLAGKSGICAHCSAVFVPTRSSFILIEPLNRRP